MTADWMADGLCQLPAYTPLYADRLPRGMTRKQRTAAAKAVCRRCNVLDTCRTWALDQEDDKPVSYRAGILGGLTAKERAEHAAAETADDQGGAA